MRKKLLLPMLIAALVFSGMCVCAAQPQIIQSTDNLFTVSYTNENIASGGWYSIMVLAPTADMSDFTKSDVLFMRQCTSENNGEIMLENVSLKNDFIEGDLYIGGPGLGTLTQVAILVNHNCGSDVTYHTGNEADCENSGNIEYWECSDCGTIVSEGVVKTAASIELPAFNHRNKVTTPEVIPQRCQETGNIEYTYCPDCEKYFSDSDCQNEITQAETILTLPHDPGDLVNAEEPTCSQDGHKAYYQCSDCGKYFEDEQCQTEILDITVPATHTLEKKNAVAPGCNSDGILEHWHCNGECGKDFADETAQTLLVSTVDPAVGHSWSTAANGRQTCSVCGEKKNVEIASGVGSGGGGGAATETFTVSFVTNCDASIAAVKIKAGKSLGEGTIPQITKNGYQLAGWYTDKGLTNKYDFSKAVNKSFTLYAKWEEGTQSSENENLTETQNGNYTDVEESDWFYDAVMYAKEKALMNGVDDGRFAPDDNITRAMLVTILYRLENEPEVKAATFNDVEKDSWYSAAVAWASENSITSGVNENEFAPDNSINREQIATMLYRYARLKGYDISAVENASLVSFTDSSDVSQYAVSAFKWAVEENIMNGKTETTLNPRDNATRAETAALLVRIVEKYSK